MTQARQLAFPFPQTDFYDASGFLRGQCNAEALAWMDQPLEWPGLRLAVAGPHGSGKTHLLQAFIQRHNGTLMPGEAIRHLVALPHDGVIAVDDADCAPDQEALLHLLNAAAERKLPLLLAATLPPSRWPVALPDLVSRLRATPSVELGQPEDSLLRALLARLLADRQLAVSEAVQDYLLARLPRTGAALREAACRLDRASLAAGSGVTRAIASQVLETMGGRFDEDLGDGSLQCSPKDGALL